MEVKGRIKYDCKWSAVFICFVFLLTACNSPECIERLYSDIHPSRHTLIPLTPTFSIEMSGDTLYNQNLLLPKKKEFPLIGIIYVDGKGYRFMGSSSLCIQALAPLAGDSCGWKGKYTFVHPKNDWKELDYNDTDWQEGRAAFGTEGHKYVTNTFWDVENIFVRRHITLDKEALNDRKLYIRFRCDDNAIIYCNGDEVVRSGNTYYPIGCQQLPDSVVKKLQEGDNLLAAYSYDSAYDAFLDFGLYAENKEYDDIGTAQLISVDVQPTQTHYSFQCGSVELQLSFVSPSLLQQEEFMGCPVGFLSYQVVSADERTHDVEVLFDLDMGWMFDRVQIKESVEQGWKVIQGDSLYVAVNSEDMQSTYKDGRIILTQKNTMLKGTDEGVLLLGYEEGDVLQYFGKNLPYYWQRDKKTGIKDILRNIGNKYRLLQRMCDENDLYYSRKLSLQENNIKADKVIPFYRNFMSAHRLSVALDGHLLCYGSIVGKVRDAFDSFPFLTFYERIDWMKSLLKPVFDCCENGQWMKQFPPFDIGSFPIAIHQESVNDYGIEMASDMLMMTLAIVKAEKSFDYAKKHWGVVSQWGDYLVKMELKRQVLVEVEQLPSAKEQHVKSALGVIAYRELIELQKRKWE